MIHPTAYIARGAIVVGDVHLGEHASVWYHCVLRGDSDRITVGKQSNIQDLTVMHADAGIPCTVGDRVGVGHRSILHGCTVDHDCLIGMGATLMNNVHVGTGSVVGAGALLTEGTVVPPGSLVMGVPGRVVREVDDDLRDRIRHTWEHYVAEAQRHRAGAYPIHQDAGSPNPRSPSDL